MKKFSKKKKKKMKEKDGYGGWDESEEKEKERNGIYGERWKIDERGWFWLKVSENGEEMKKIEGVS